MRAGAAFVLMLVLAGCTTQRGYLVGPRSTPDFDDYVVKPIAGFPLYVADCVEMPDGSCELRPPVSSAKPSRSAPQRIAVAPRLSVQQASAPSPLVASVPPSSPAESRLAEPPVEAPAS